jgi:hypothetical protein
MSLTLALMLPAPYAGAADEVQGKVVSITLTADCPAENACAANVGLAANDGKIVTFHVRPDTEIMRGGRLILLDQLGVGNAVRIPKYDQITTAMPTAQQIFLFD